MERSDYSIQEYRELEQQSDIKYEYHDGELFALAGGTLNHGLLSGNIYSEIRAGLATAGKGCKALNSEVKLAIETVNSFVYPDAMVVCGEVQTSQHDANAVISPILIVEVLSKSTADYDRGDKFHLYRQIPGLQEYVLVEQSRAQVELFYKRPQTDLWQITRTEGFDSELYLQSLDLKIPMKDLYFDVNFS